MADTAPLRFHPKTGHSLDNGCVALNCHAARAWRLALGVPAAQIRYLVSNLTKKNQQASVAELNQLVALYGQDALVYLLACLIEETDFASKAVAGPQAKDLPKVALLHLEVAAAARRPNFAVVVCLALEGASRTDARGRASSAPPKVTEVRKETPPGGSPRTRRSVSRKGNGGVS